MRGFPARRLSFSSGGHPMRFGLGKSLVKCCLRRCRKAFSEGGVRPSRFIFLLARGKAGGLLKRLFLLSGTCLEDGR